MPYTYRCESCRSHFQARRKRCTNCGTTGAWTDRTTCWDCGSGLADSEVQRCPRCGSEDVEQLADFWT